MEIKISRTDILEDDTEKQPKIAKFIDVRQCVRKRERNKRVVKLPTPAPTLGREIC